MTSIEDFRKKIKGGGGFKVPNLTLRQIPDDLFLGLIIILVAFGSFGLGRLSKIEGTKIPIQIENAPEVTAETFSGGTKADTVITQQASLISANQTSDLVGSRNGTKYHYTWCSGAQRIAETNRIYFTSKSDAEARGYTPAINCKGL